MKKTLKGFVRDYGGPPKRHLGQVFLIERSIQEKIIRLAELEPEDTVVEIGPGPGALTREILSRVRRLIAIEIDPRLAAYLRASLESSSGLFLICMDALRFDYRRASSRLGIPLKIVGNLPYSISGPLLFSFMEHCDAFKLLVLMLQKEVAERLTSTPGNKEYGSLTVLSRFYLDITVEHHVSRRCFSPVPKVDSTIVRCVPKKIRGLLEPGQTQTFRRVVKAAFSTRRKTLFNSLRLSLNPALPENQLHEVLSRCGLNANRRAETLCLEEFVGLTLCIHEAQKSMDKPTGFADNAFPENPVPRSGRGSRRAGRTQGRSAA